MSGKRTELPVWQQELNQWDSVEGERLHALLIEYAPTKAFPGRSGESRATRSYTVGMLAALCPREIVSITPPDELQRKLAAVFFEHKASNPYDDDEHWLARSPFDAKFYVFSSLAMGGGWPTEPSMVLEERPSWFDED
jgi:hypothetical protein